MLAFLLFAGALHVDLGELRTRAWPVFALAVVGTIISTGVGGIGLWAAASVALALSLPESPAKAALLSATYAVVLFTILVQGTTLGVVARRTIRMAPTKETI